MVNTGGKVFILTTKLYMKTNDATIIGPEKQNPEGKADVYMEGTAINKK